MIKILNENKNNKKECFVKLSPYDDPSLWNDQFNYDILDNDYYLENIYMDFSLTKRNSIGFFNQDLKTDASIIEDEINDVLYDLEYDDNDEFINNIDDDEKLMKTIENSLQKNIKYLLQVIGDEKCINQIAKVIFDLYRDGYRYGDVDASEQYDEIISILEIKYNTKFEQYTCTGVSQGDYYPVIYDAQKLNREQMDYVSDMLFGMFDLYEYKSSENEFEFIPYPYSETKDVYEHLGGYCGISPKDIIIFDSEAAYEKYLDNLYM